MKIGVVTHWWCKENYGQLLQAYAFQQFLIARGHDPFLIRYFPGLLAGERGVWPRIRQKAVHPLEFVRGVLNRLTGAYQKYVLRQKRVGQTRKFDEFRTKNIRMTKQIYRSYAEICQSSEIDADIYSVGSDVVWKMLPLNDNGRVHFLDFGRTRARRIAYSPSFGTDRLSERYKLFAGPLIAKLDYVSVREQSGVGLCAEMGRHDVIRVVDPVFLLTREEWFVRFAVRLDSSSSGYFAYLLDMVEPPSFEQLDSIAKTAGETLQIETVYADMGFPEESLVDLTVPEWIERIATAKCVFTNSFHAASFSLLFHTPFVVFLKYGGMGMDDRLLSLLKSLHLQNRICSSRADIETIVRMPINWKQVDEVLTVERNKSIRFLERAGI